MPPEQLLTPLDLSDWFKVPVATLYAWRSHGGGPPAVRIGRHLRYHRRDVELWLQSQASKLGAAPCDINFFAQLTRGAPLPPGGAEGSPKRLADR